MVFIRLVLNGFTFPFKKKSFLFFDLFYFIWWLNILILPFTNIWLIFILREEYYVINETNALKLYSILIRIPLFHLLSGFTNVCVYANL